MKNTTNYSLKLPEGHDKYNVQDFNGNTEKIDIELKSHADAIDDRYNKTEVDNKFSMHEMNVDWKESVDTFDDIATIYPNPENGWTVNAKDTNYTYRYDGTAWVAISANAIPKATEQLDGLMGKEKVTEINSINYRLGKAEGIVYTCDTKCYGEAPYLRFLVEEVTSISMDIEIIELHYTNPETGNEVNIDTGRTDIYINYLGTKPFEIEICVGKRFFPEPEEGEQPKIGRCKLIIKDNISDLTEQNKKDINELNADLSNMALDLNIIKESLPSKTLPKDKKIIDSLDALKGNFIFYLNSYDNYGGCDVPGKENYFGIVFAAGAAYSQLICMGNLTGNLYTRVKINGSWSGWYTK